jgi:hypothetical protein
MIVYHWGSKYPIWRITIWLAIVTFVSCLTSKDDRQDLPFRLTNIQRGARILKPQSFVLPHSLSFHLRRIQPAIIGSHPGRACVLAPSLRLKGGLAAAKKKLPEDAPQPAKKRQPTKKKDAKTEEDDEALVAATTNNDEAVADNEVLADDSSPDKEWTVEKAGDLEVLSTRESVLKRPDMWIGDISTVVKLAYEVVYEALDASNSTSMEENNNVPMETSDGGFTTPPATPTKSRMGAGASSPVLATPSKLSAMMALKVNDQPAPAGRLVARQRELKYNAGVLKTFDEIIVNAVDRQVEVENMREIRVYIDRATGELGVWNDGPGIDPVMHKSGKGLIPEVAFGEFMASTNFDDDTRKRFTGGRFGVGAKATNAWSKWFRVTTKHAASGMVYNQTWSDNMVHKTKATVVKDASGDKGGFTEIRWLPDYKRFGLTEGLDDDTYACMVMRVYDICACTKETIKVTLNGSPLPFSTLSEYADLFWGSTNTSEGRERVYFTLGERGSGARLEIMLATSSSAHLEARGMINGVLCSQGTHIDFIVNKVSDGLVDRAIKQVASVAQRLCMLARPCHSLLVHVTRDKVLVALVMQPRRRKEWST